MIDTRERQQLHLTNRQLRDLVYEEQYLDVEGTAHSFITIESEVTGHNRHSAENRSIVKRISDDIYFEIFWEDSVKDSMGWIECNADENYCFDEVFPETVEIVVYR